MHLPQAGLQAGCFISDVLWFYHNMRFEVHNSVSDWSVWIVNLNREVLNTMISRLQATEDLELMSDCLQLVQTTTCHCDSLEENCCLCHHESNTGSEFSSPDICVQHRRGLQEHQVKFFFGVGVKMRKHFIWCTGNAGLTVRLLRLQPWGLEKFVPDFFHLFFITSNYRIIP